MRDLRLPTGLAALLAVSFAVSSAIANPLITAITQNGTGVSAVLPIATSASSQLPQPAGAGTQGALVDEAYAYTTRTHEWTAAVTDTTTFLLSTTTGNTNGAPVATQSVRPFPSYLNGLEYAQFDNASRSITDFSVNMTFAQAVKAYLFIDNRTGLASGTKANTTDPDLTGPLAWVTTDGWTRVNTGIMPNGQADYLGIDEGATVASADLRTHAASGNVAGSGFGVNNFAAIYTKNFPAGANTGVLKATANGGIDFYGVAVAPVPEPTTLVLAVLGICGGAMLAYRRRSM